MRIKRTGVILTNTFILVLTPHCSECLETCHYPISNGLRDGSRHDPADCFIHGNRVLASIRAEPAYQEHLIEQIRRHLERLPSASGFCIDRLDWLRFYNLDRDDNVSWFDGAPARSMLWSWLQIMNRLGPLVHQAGKVIFVNPIYKRLDALKHVDGLFDEMADDPCALNGVGFVGICKPVIVWRDKPVAPGEADSYFQRLLFLGVFPMCPYPQNDHGLDWGTAEGRRPFTDYGPLLPRYAVESGS